MPEATLDSPRSPYSDAELRGFATDELNIQRMRVAHAEAQLEHYKKLVAQRLMQLEANIAALKADQAKLEAAIPPLPSPTTEPIEEAPENGLHKRSRGRGGARG